MAKKKSEGEKKTINQRQKGAVGEREFAKLLRKHGYEAERGVQHSGGKDSPDVKTNMPRCHWEIKRTERLRLHDALEQSQRDAGEDEMALVAYRRNRSNWLVIMNFDEWIELYNAWAKEQKHESKLEAVSEVSTARDGNVSSDSQ